MDNSSDKKYNNPDINDMYQSMIKEIKYMCNNMAYAYANPSKFNFLELVKWFIELKKDQLSRGYCLHSFIRCNCNDRKSCHTLKNNPSIWSLKVINNPNFSKKILSLIFKNP